MQVLFERQDGSRVRLQLDKLGVAAAMATGKFVAVIRQPQLTVLRAKNVRTRRPSKPVTYGGRTNHKCPSGYRGG